MNPSGGSYTVGECRRLVNELADRDAEIARLRGLFTELAKRFRRDAVMHKEEADKDTNHRDVRRDHDMIFNTLIICANSVEIAALSIEGSE